MLFNERPRIVLETPDSSILYYPELLSSTLADGALDALVSNTAWRQERMLMYGRDTAFPRLTAWYGDPDRPYAFSGIILQPEPWTPLLQEIKQVVQQLSNEQYNSVLLNLYRNGQDSISWHTDDEKELGSTPTVASVSFGAARRFMIRERDTKRIVAQVELEQNSLLVMRGATMKRYQHQVPKTAVKVSARINLTFRTILSSVNT